MNPRRSNTPLFQRLPTPIRQRCLSSPVAVLTPRKSTSYYFHRSAQRLSEGTSSETQRSNVKRPVEIAISEIHGRPICLLCSYDSRRIFRFQRLSPPKEGPARLTGKRPPKSPYTGGETVPLYVRPEDSVAFITGLQALKCVAGVVCKWQVASGKWRP